MARWFKSNRNDGARWVEEGVVTKTGRSALQIVAVAHT